MLLNMQDQFVSFLDVDEQEGEDLPPYGVSQPNFVAHNCLAFNFDYTATYNELMKFFGVFIDICFTML